MYESTLLVTVGVMSQTYGRALRTELRRRPSRGAYDAPTVHAILDQGFVCHVGFVADGQPFVIPTGYARQGETLYLHGSAASRMLHALGNGIEACVTVTLIDGLVLARAVMHHSVNYRSVVVLGRARPVTDPGEKLRALRAITNHIVPGRWEETRPPTALELKATAVLALPLEEASAKVRTGPPVDDEEDLTLPVWAGVVPLRQVAGQPVPDLHVPSGTLPFDIARLSLRA